MRKPRRLTAGEQALWRHIAESVEPLPGRRSLRPSAEPEASAATSVAAEAASDHKPQLDLEKLDLEKLVGKIGNADLKPPLSQPARGPKPAEVGGGKGNQTPGLDRKTRDKLRRGLLPIEGRVDLHGKTQEAAHTALDAFLAGAHYQGLRCVLVITGRGMKPVDGGRVSRGVLKQAVPRWLKEGANRQRVLAYAPARPNHGGEGALYVLLRRVRE